MNDAGVATRRGTRTPPPPTPTSRLDPDPDGTWSAAEDVSAAGGARRRPGRRRRQRRDCRRGLEPARRPRREAALFLASRRREWSTPEQDLGPRRPAASAPSWRSTRATGSRRRTSCSPAPALSSPPPPAPGEPWARVSPVAVPRRLRLRGRGRHGRRRSGDRHLARTEAPPATSSRPAVSTPRLRWPPGCRSGRDRRHAGHPLVAGGDAWSPIASVASSFSDGGTGRGRA